MTKNEWDQRDCVSVVERLGVFRITGTYIQNLRQRLGNGREDKTI